jgi:hypothetical protein
MPSVEIKATKDNPGVSGRVRVWIEGLGPYQSLLLLAVPVCLVEPMKLVAVAIAGEGHWLTGTAMIVAAYAASLLVIDRLFLIVKPKLLTMPWFASIWNRFVTLRTRMARGLGLRTPSEGGVQ